MILGIDASNVGGGGGITHLKEVLIEYCKSDNYNDIEKIIVFSSTKVLLQLPTKLNIEKVTFPQFNGSLFKRVLFQLNGYDREIEKRCDLLLSITGDYVGSFKPLVGMSRNMLLYERDIWREIKQPKEIIRFWINYLKQKRSFASSLAVIFISRYAKNVISNRLDLRGKNLTIIHHGVSSRFRGVVSPQHSIDDFSLTESFKFLYISTIHVYKHQWNVVKAVSNLRIKGYPIELNLVGGGIFAPAEKKLFDIIKEVDPNRVFIHNHGHIDYNEIDQFYNNANGIIYASTCENMPNTLIEAMASGVPIACSNKNPMPEFLKGNGFYFDSYDVKSIENALEEMLLKPEKRLQFAYACQSEAQKYSWTVCSRLTFNYLTEMFKLYKNADK